MSHAYADSFFQDCPDQNIDAMWAAYADSCRIEELESENAKLIVKLNAEHIVRQNVEVENAKLRDLLQYVADNHLCGMWLLEQMRELGIEVEA